MATRIIWSPEAADDLDQIAAFIARDSPRYASQVASDVLDAVELAAQHPGAGRMVPEFDDANLREMIVYSYRVIYRVKPDAIGVAAIIHGARDLQKAVGARSV